MDRISGKNGQVSKVEIAKREGRQLRGTIAETLASDATHFGHDDLQLLKFHGTYQQDDRDQRKARSEDEDKSYSFMVRVALPAGLLTAEQYLAFDDLAGTHANGTLRITTRQGFQFHGVLKGDLKPTIAGINSALATTIAACGDVRRNVMGCPVDLDHPAHAAVRRAAERIAEELNPTSRAYYEIWLDEERQVTTQEEEPFYGKQYLPRKFKAGVALSTDNCIDIYAQDAGLLAVVDGDTIRGFNVLVGGGLGHDAWQGRHPRPPRGAARLRGGSARGGRDPACGRDLPRSRQPRRPALRPPQVSHQRMGHRPLPGGVPATGGVSAPSRRSISPRPPSTITSAPIAPATGAGSTACSSRAGASRTPSASRSGPHSAG